MFIDDKLGLSKSILLKKKYPPHPSFVFQVKTLRITGTGHAKQPVVSCPLMQASIRQLVCTAVPCYLPLT